MYHNASTDSSSDMHDLNKTIISTIVNALAMPCTGILYVMTIKAILHLPSFSKWLLKSLSIADFISSTTFVCGGILMMLVNFDSDPCARSTKCVVMSAFLTTATLASFAWNITIGVYCTVILLGEDGISQRRHESKRILLGMLCWGGSVAVSSAALIRGAFGPTHTPLVVICWIRTCDKDLAPWEQLFWMMLTSKLWELLCFLTIVNVIFVGISFRRSTSQDGFPWAVTESPSITSEDRGDLSPDILSNPEVNLSDRRANMKDVKLFLWIPLCFLLCRISGFVRFIMNICFLSVPDIIPDTEIVKSLCNIFGYLTAFERITPVFNIFLVLRFCPESWTWLYGQCTSQSCCRKTSKFEVVLEIEEPQPSINLPDETTDNSVNALRAVLINRQFGRIRTLSDSVVTISSGIMESSNSSDGTKDKCNTNSLPPSV